SPGASLLSPPVGARFWAASRARIPGLQRGAPLFARATAFVSDSLEILPNNAKLLGRLARSEDRWLRQCGLPAVVAATISGRFDVTTLSTSAYCNLADAQIARAHADAGRRFFAMVRQEAIHRGWDVPAFAASGLLASAGTGRRFGSYHVPEPAAVTRAIRALEGKLRPVDVQAPLQTLISAFNLLAVYEWLRLGWATALRPRRDPVVTASRVHPQA